VVVQRFPQIGQRIAQVRDRSRYVFQQRGARFDASGLERGDVLSDFGLVADAAGRITVEPSYQHQLRLNLDRERVLLEPDFVAAVYLPVVKTLLLLKQFQRFRLDQLWQRVQRGLQVWQPAGGRLRLPVSEYPSPLNTTAPCS